MPIELDLDASIVLAVYIMVEIIIIIVLINNVVLSSLFFSSSSSYWSIYDSLTKYFIVHCLISCGYAVINI